MSIFGSILSAVFGTTPTEAVATADTAPASVAPEVGAAVDIPATLDALVAKSGEALNWRMSIVDLMKALKLDSTLGARKALATELHYTGDMEDSASMNIWLHAQVIAQLAANGGKVPADLLTK